MIAAINRLTETRPDPTKGRELDDFLQIATSQA